MIVIKNFSELLYNGVSFRDGSFQKFSLLLFLVALRRCGGTLWPKSRNPNMGGHTLLVSVLENKYAKYNKYYNYWYTDTW